MPLLEFAKGVGDLLPAAEEHLAHDERLAVEEAGDGVLGEVHAPPVGEPHGHVEVEVRPGVIERRR